MKWNWRLSITLGKRSGKFYFRNEKEKRRKRGMKPAPGSGSGWVVKEDGENDIAMVQLRSTDSSSYRLDILDMKKLEYHASVSRKLPIFLVQFLKQDKIYAIVEVGDIPDLAIALETGSVPPRSIFEEDEINEAKKKRQKVKASVKAREQFFKERSEKFGKR